jgi:hypothetical protein
LQGPYSDGFYFENNQPCLNLGYETVVSDVSLATVTELLGLSNDRYVQLSQNCLEPASFFHWSPYWQTTHFQNSIPAEVVSNIQLVEKSLEKSEFAVQVYQNHVWKATGTVLKVPNLSNYFFSVEGKNIYLLTVAVSRKTSTKKDPNDTVTTLAIYRFNLADS